MTAPVSWIASFAAQRGFRYEPDADERWLRAWEPYTTVRLPLRYEHSLQATGSVGSISIARVVMAIDAPAPNGATVSTEISSWIVITQDTRMTGRLAVTSDFGTPWAEPLDLVTMKRRASGDPHFDHVFATFAPTPDDVIQSLTPSLRKLLLSWRMPIHAEVRPGGFVLLPPTLGADPQSLAWFSDAIHLFGEKATKGGAA
ncbi:MAG: hypothetical protein JNL38_25195 [Myxococcales bacterium]|nr:hypothetical protein [Myxococcales bacterium]